MLLFFPFVVNFMRTVGEANDRKEGIALCVRVCVCVCCPELLSRVVSEVSCCCRRRRRRRRRLTMMDDSNLNADSKVDDDSCNCN